jgi:hypothetical protein
LVGDLVGRGVGGRVGDLVGTGVGALVVGAGVGAGVGLEVNTINCVEMLALAGTVLKLIEFTVIFKLSSEVMKLENVMVSPALSFA